MLASVNPAVFDHQLLSKHVFALVDSAMVDYLPEGVVSAPVVPPNMASSAHLMPRLIELGAIGESARADLLNSLYEAQERAEQPAVPLLIQSPLSAQEFSDYWNSLQVATPSAARTVWLRMHDPRVLHQLLRILTHAQKARLLNRIDSCSYWLGDSWVNVTVKEALSLPVPAEPGSGYRWDWVRVEQIGLINRALQAAGIFQAAAIDTQSALAEQLIARARDKHHLSDSSDLVEFAMRGLTVGARFDEHPDIIPAIKPGSDPEDDASLADRLAMVDELIWSEIASA